MGATNTEHRPLVSGIWVWSGKKDEEESRLESITRGTLTGLATRNSDGKKFLVTCLHVMTGVQLNPSGDEEMYQESVSADKKVGSLPAWNEDKPAWVPIVAGQDQDNVADVAMCELDQGVTAEFAMHDSSDHSGSSRKIIAGVVEPVDDDENPMQLTMLGARGGEGMVTVKDVNETREIGDITFTGLTILDCSQRLAKEGDSGAACLYRVGDNRYKMSCIVFAREDLTGREGWAFPASVAERELHIIFGDRAPVANAGPDQTVAPGAAVTLDSSGSSDPDGDTLTYKWEQVFGSERAAIAEHGVTLSDNTAVKPTFTAPSPSTGSKVLTFKLTVTDSLGQTTTDTVTIAVTRPPVANAGSDQTVDPGAAVTLDGSGSSDPDGDTLTYRWEQVFDSARPVIPPHNRVALSSVTAVSPTFTAPPRTTTLIFRLTVTDSLGQTATDTVRVAVKPEIWGAWSNTGRRRGSAQNRDKEQRRTSSYGNTQTRWIADPAPETWGAWSNTGRRRGSGQNRDKEQRRTSSYGNAQTLWVSDPEPPTPPPPSRPPNRGSDLVGDTPSPPPPPPPSRPPNRGSDLAGDTPSPPPRRPHLPQGGR